MIKHISFDLWGTLINSHPEYGKHKDKLFHNLVKDWASTLRVKDTLKQVKNLVNSINEECRGHITPEQIIAMSLAALEVEVKRDTIDHIKDELTTIFYKYPPSLVDDRIPHILKELTSQDITLNICSNTALTPGLRLRDLLVRLGIYDYFKFTIFSDEENISKPDIRIFSKIVKLSGCSPKEITHVGDNQYTDGSCTKLSIPYYHLDNHSSINNLLPYVNSCNSSPNLSTLIIT